MSKKPLSVDILAKTALSEGFLRLYRYVFEVERHQGGQRRLTFEVMERGNAVAVLGHDPKRDQLVLVNEFRPGAFVNGEYAFRDNLVAGAIEAGEDPLQAAVREMREETGLLLTHPVFIHSGVYVSSGGTSEKIALVYGEVDTRDAGGVHGNAAENEDILTVLLSSSAFLERIRNGTIDDMKTLLAGYWFADRQTHAAPPSGILRA